MTGVITLFDNSTRDDLKTFLERLMRAGEAEVRMIAGDGVVAVFGCTQAPEGILDQTPVVLGMRAFALAENVRDPLDVTVQGRALLDRLARQHDDGLLLDVPDVQVTATWAGVLPPRSGWKRQGLLDAPSMRQVATEGIKRIEEALPNSPGEPMVRAIRARTWGAEVAPGVPAAVAFALETLGFLEAEQTVLISHSKLWLRFSTARGEVLLRSRGAL